MQGYIVAINVGVPFATTRVVRYRQPRTIGMSDASFGQQLERNWLQGTKSQLEVVSGSRS